MPASKVRLKTMIVETARLSRLPRLLTPSFGGVGAIIAMHRVREPSGEPFQPNKPLEVTPSFLDETLTHLRERDIDIVSLDEVERRLRERDFARRFVSFTLDDGYADNYVEAFPVFKAHGAPFAIYLTTGFVDRTSLFWWMILEEVIRQNDEVTLRCQGREEGLTTGTLKEKEQAFDVFHGRFRSLAADEVENITRGFCDDYGIDPAALCAEHAMSWDMARAITKDGLGRIEAHTLSHLALSLERPAEIVGNMKRSFARIEEEVGRAPRHFAYPFGDAKAVTRRDIDLLASLPIATATTMRSGTLRSDDAQNLLALPRITLNGYYQSEGYVDLALSGLPSLLQRS